MPKVLRVPPAHRSAAALTLAVFLAPGLAAAPLSLPSPPPAPPEGATTSLVSVAISGLAGNGASGTGSGRPHALSDSGRFLAFTSAASDLVAGDTNGQVDVFLRDRLLRTTVRCSIGDAGQEGNGTCEQVAVSNDGRFVAYASLSSNLVPGDSNGAFDVFLWDAATGRSSLISRTPTGEVGNGESMWPSLDGNGDRVAFHSRASNLVVGDTNGNQDVFLFERAGQSVSRESVASDESQGSFLSNTPSLARAGRFLVFASRSIFDPADPNTRLDIYVRDLLQGTTELLLSQSGGFNQDLAEPSISADGRYVAFHSRASNLPDGSSDARWDAYRYDRSLSELELVSTSTDGIEAIGDCFIGGMSSDGSWIVFATQSGGLVPGVTAGLNRAYVRRVDQRWTEVISVSASGGLPAGTSEEPAVSGDGQFLAFRSNAPGVTPNDGNGFHDTFLRDLGFGTRSAGAPYCFSTPNSSGLASEASVFGSNRLDDQNLTLRAEALPLNSLGYFLFSRDPGSVPGFGGSQGKLCLGGSLFRLSSFVASSGSVGAVTLPLPFAQLPGGVTLAPGDSWHFQYWFRDTAAGQPISNTSSGVCVPLY